MITNVRVWLILWHFFIYREWLLVESVLKGPGVKHLHLLWGIIWRWMTSSSSPLRQRNPKTKKTLYFSSCPLKQNMEDLWIIWLEVTVSWCWSCYKTYKCVCLCICVRTWPDSTSSVLVFEPLWYLMGPFNQQELLNIWCFYSSNFPQIAKRMSPNLIQTLFLNFRNSDIGLSLERRGADRLRTYSDDSPARQPRIYYQGSCNLVVCSIDSSRVLLRIGSECVLGFGKLH